MTAPTQSSLNATERNSYMIKTCPLCGKKPQLLELTDAFGDHVCLIRCVHNKDHHTVVSERYDWNSAVTVWNRRIANE